MPPSKRKHAAATRPRSCAPKLVSYPFNGALDGSISAMARGSSDQLLPPGGTSDRGALTSIPEVWRDHKKTSVPAPRRPIQFPSNMPPDFTPPKICSPVNADSNLRLNSNSNKRTKSLILARPCRVIGNFSPTDHSVKKSLPGGEGDGRNYQVGEILPSKCDPLQFSTNDGSEESSVPQPCCNSSLHQNSSTAESNHKLCILDPTDEYLLQLDSATLTKLARLKQYSDAAEVIDLVARSMKSNHIHAGLTDISIQRTQPNPPDHPMVPSVWTNVLLRKVDADASNCNQVIKWIRSKRKRNINAKGGGGSASNSTEYSKPNEGSLQIAASALHLPRGPSKSVSDEPAITLDVVTSTEPIEKDDISHVEACNTCRDEEEVTSAEYTPLASLSPEKPSLNQPEAASRSLPGIQDTNVPVPTIPRPKGFLTRSPSPSLYCALRSRSTQRWSKGLSPKESERNNASALSFTRQTDKRPCLQPSRGTVGGPVHRGGDTETTQDTLFLSRARHPIATVVVNPAGSPRPAELLCDIPPELKIDMTEIDLDDEPISRGTFGTVFKAKYRGNIVAVKWCHTQDPPTVEQLKNFERELNAYYALRHERICHFYGASVENLSTLAFVTEYLPGGNAFELFYEEKVQVSAYNRLKMARQLTEVVHYMHTRKPLVIHRDIKTPNVIIDDDFNIKLCDFGKTRFMTRSFLLLDDNGGSPRYMAPECFDPHGIISEKADIWSLACCLIEFFGGPLPHENQFDNDAVIHRILQMRCAPIVPRWFHPAVRSVLRACFEWSPSARPGASEILMVLDVLTPSSLDAYKMNKKGKMSYTSAGGESPPNYYR